MEPLNLFLAEELAAAYQEIARYRSNAQSLVADILRLETELETQSVQAAQIRQDYQDLCGYTTWVEERVSLPGRRTLPRRLLRQAWQNGATGMRLVNRRRGVTLETLDMTNWHEVVDLTDTE